MSPDLHSTDEVSDRLVAAVLALAAERGAAAITSRLLAERAGLSASAVNYRFGSLDGLLEAAGRAADLRRASLWQRLTGRLGTLTGEPGDFGPLAFTALREVAASLRGEEALFWHDTIDAARTGRRPVAREAMAAERAFWARLTQACKLEGPAPSTLQAFALGVRFAYAVFERPEDFDPWALALVQRLAVRAAGEAPEAGVDNLLRRRAEEEADRRFAGQARAHETAVRILETAIRLILEEGAPALTHRRIASEAGLSVSSVLHFYGARETILEAAYQAINSQARQRAVPELPEPGTLDAEALMARLAARRQETSQEQRRAFAAMQGLILSAATSAHSRSIAEGFLARMGATSISLLAGLKAPRGRIGRLDAQLLSMTLTHVATLSLCEPDGDADDDFPTIGRDLIESLFVVKDAQAVPPATGPYHAD